MRRTACIVSIAMVVAFALALWAGPVVKAGPCQPYTQALGIHVFAGMAQVNLAGTVYSDGQTAYITAGCGLYHYTISPVVGSGTFIQWQTNAGTLSSWSAGTTTYTPSATSGSLYMVVTRGTPPSYQSFGGYALAASGVYTVTARFTVPAFTYVPGSDPNEVGFGVGIGGIYGSNYGWWTMLVASVSSSGSVTYTEQEWIEPGPTSGLKTGQLATSVAMPQVASGHVIDVGVHIDQASGQVQDFVCDRTAGGCQGTGYPSLVYDVETVQWFAADMRDCFWPDKAPTACHGAPQFAPIPVTVPAPGNQWTSSSPSLFGPLLRGVGTGLYPNNPPNIAPGYISGSSSFQVFSFGGQVQASGNPAADSTVSSANGYKDTNYGTATVLWFGTNAYPNALRDFLKWNLQGLIPVGSAVVSASLRLYLDHWSYGSSISDGQLYYVPDNSWTETGITWNNMPSAATLRLNNLAFSGTGVWYSFDVTNDVWSGVNTGSWNVTFMLRRAAEDGSLHEFVFDSKEFSNPALRPVLVVQYLA